MTFSFHSISDQRAESVNVGKSEGKETIPWDIPINIPGRCSQMGRRHFKALQRMLGREGKGRTHDPEHSRFHSYDGQPHHGRPANGGDKMHVYVCLLQSQVCCQCHRQSSLVRKTGHQPPPHTALHAGCTGEAQTWGGM